MSSASTPRVTRSASPDNEDGILTPGRKIKAMLAAFDSDSGSDTDNSAPLKRPVFSNLVTDPTEITGGHEDTEDEDEDEDLVLPKGRMAARMQAQQQEEEEDATMTDAEETAYDRVTRRLHAQSEAPQPTETQQSESAERPSNDGLYGKGPKRRLLHRGDQSHATEDEDENPEDPLRRDRSESPLFVQNEDEPGNQNPDEIRSNASPKKNDRFLALVAQKRKEREERERIEAEKRAARVEQMKQFSSDILSGEDSDDGEGSARMLTQQARPTRKASKKALEEMSRETQRMSRSMQLTHQARTKKKITKESFLARFNFGVPPEPQTTTPAVQNSSTTASSAPSSDGESNKEKATPPTSPIRESFEDREKAPTFAQNRGDTFDLPTIDDLMTESSKNPEPGTVERAEVLDTVPAPQKTTTTYKPKVERKQLTKPPVRVRFTREDVAQHQKDDGDDDLEVITSPARCRKIAAFENLPARHAQESASMLKLKLLAHLTSPSRKSKSMSPAELSASLRLQARQQALQERREKIEELRAKGIVIETAEDRAAMEADVEDLLDKARQEAAEIARREKAARKKGRKNGEGEEDSDDEADYIPSGSEDEQEIDAEDDHDSEREDEEEDEDEEDGEEENGLVEDEAGEADESEGEQSDVMSLDGGQEPPVQAVARKRRNRVISDDEEEDDEPQQQPEVKTPARSVPASAGSAKRPQFPDLPMSNDFTMGLTQAFAGTLGDSQPNDGGDSFKIIQSLPDPGLPTTDLFAVDSQVMVKDSQEQRRDSIDLFADYTQSNSRISESPARHTWSQPSQIPEPTQDAGFVLSPFDQSKRFADPPISTIDTVLLPEHESPIAKRKGRLLQRGRPAQLSDEEDADFEIKASAFDVMKKAAKKPAKPFDKMKSEARGHFDEAAEESEDEYAGLGGASDDEVGDEDEYDQQMINDDSQEVVDEKQLAALNANHQRNMDEKQVSKLLKDITTGALRRRRGADDDLDLDDSDDERVARRRAKQREFARMRKALLADDKIGEIASNPKTQAFFKAIEDRDSDDDMDLDFLENKATDSQNESSQDIVPESQPTDHNPAISGINKRKRPLEPSADDTTNRPPPNLRRTKASAVSKKPATLAEIRESVSFLIETPEYDTFRDDASADEDEHHDDVINDSDRPSSEDETPNQLERRASADGFTIPPNPRRSRARVVDRLALLRAASSNSATSNKAAFMSSSSDALPQIGFRPPAFMRRSTTNSSSTSLSSTSSSMGSTTTNTRPKTGPLPGMSNIKKGAVNYYTAARERERERELQAKESGGASNIAALLSKQRAAGGGLGALMGKGSWE